MYAFVIEDSEKATEFLENNRNTLAEDLDNRVLELTTYDGMGENNARKQAIFEMLKNSGIGFYEAYTSEKPEFKEVKSQN